MVINRPTLFGVSVIKSKFFLDKSVEPVFPLRILTGSPWHESFSLASERNLSVLTAVWLKPPGSGFDVVLREGSNLQNFRIIIYYFFS